MIYQNEYEKSLYDKPSKSGLPELQHVEARLKAAAAAACEREKQAKGPSTYLHAGASKTGWPHDHSTEDTYEIPPHIWHAPDIPAALKIDPEEREYRAEFGTRGEALLVLDRTTTIATFNNFADAQTAAKALNELKGY